MNALESELGDNHEQGTAQRNHKVGTHSGFLGPHLPFKSDKSSKESRYEYSKYKVPVDCHNSFVFNCLK